MNDYDALAIRYAALARDWNRLRDIEKQWMRFHKLVIATAIMLALLVVMFR